MTSGHPPEARYARPPNAYARRHLASHAAAAGRLDEVLTLEILPYLDQARLSSLLRLSDTKDGAGSKLLLSAWRSVRHRWSWEDPDANAAALDVAYCAVGGRTPTRRTATGLAWQPRWARWYSGGGVIVAGDFRGGPQVALGSVQGTSLLAVAAPYRVTLWDPSTGQQIGEPLEAEEPLRNVAIAEGPGLVLALSGANTIQIWNAVTRLPEPSIAVDATRRFAALAVGRLEDRWVVAVAGRDGRVQVRRLPDGELVREFGTGAAVTGIAAATTADGDLYLALGRADSTVEVRRAMTGEQAGRGIRLDTAVTAVALAAAGSVLTVAGSTASGLVRAWNGRDGRPVMGPVQNAGAVTSLAFGDVDGLALLASGSADRTVRVWYARSGEPVGQPLAHPMGVLSVAFGEVDGRTMLVSGCADGNARAWDPLASEQSSAPAASDSTRYASPAVDGELVAATTDLDRLRLWDADSGDVVYRHRPPRGGRVWLGRSGTRRLLVAATPDQVTVSEVETRAALRPLRRRELHLAAVIGVGITPTRAVVVEQRYASSGSAAVVDLLTDEVVAVVPIQGNPHLVLAQPHAHQIAVTHAGAVHLIDLRSGEHRTIEAPVARASYAALGGVDGSLLLAALGEGGLELWDLGSGQRVIPPIETSHTLSGLAWARLQRRDVLLTAHHSTVRVWDPRTGRQLSTLPFGTPITGLAVHQTDDESALVAVSGPGVVVTQLRQAMT